MVANMLENPSDQKIHATPPQKRQQFYKNTDDDFYLDLI